MGESPGALTEAAFYTLLSLFKPNHGYGIMQTVESMSNGRVKLGAGTMYGSLNNLLGKGWIMELVQRDRKKEYLITDLGKMVVQQEMNRLAELWTNGQHILQGGN